MELHSRISGMLGTHCPYFVIYGATLPILLCNLCMEYVHVVTNRFNDALGLSPERRGLRIVPLVQSLLRHVGHSLHFSQPLLVQ